MTAKLTRKQAAFVREFAIDLNATQAAIRAGYSPRTAQEQSSKLLSKPMVQAAVAESQAKALKRAELQADDVLEELRRVAFRDTRDLFVMVDQVVTSKDAATGELVTATVRVPRLKDPDEWSDEVAAAVEGLEVVKKNAFAGDGHIDTIYKLRLAQKVPALEILAKRFGLVKERVVVEGELNVSKLSDEDLKARIADLAKRAGIS